MDSKLKFVFVCHFGLEKVLKQEIRKLGLEVAEVTDGEVKALGDIKDIPRLNFNLRTTERVMIEVGNFKATTFDELFENVKNTEIEKFVPVDGIFEITKANQDKNSILHSSMSIQSITKKAMVDRLKVVYGVNELTETRGKYSFRVKFYKDVASIRLDTTGDSLHKRGYRVKSGLAPLTETLAAALIKVCDYKDVLIDPFCGSGTIPIEAAMIKANIPPSLDRAFVSETWDIIDSKYWKEAYDEAKSNVRTDALKDKYVKIFGYDIDKNMIRIAKENASRAGVGQMIDFETRDVKDLHLSNSLKNFDCGIILTNPPYGERLSDRESIIPIYKNFKNSYDNLKKFDLNVLTSFDMMNKIFGKETKNRKIYNGMMKTYLYTYMR